MRLKDIFQMRHFRRNNSGIILFIVLWSLVVLTVLAVGLGRTTNIELLLTKNTIGKIQSKYLAWSGVMVAIDLLAQDSKSEDWAARDTLYQCGIAQSMDDLKETFQKYNLGNGYISLNYQLFDADKKFKTVLGFEDEERKININILNIQTYVVLKNLIVLAGYSDDKAEDIALAVVDWVDPDEISIKDQQTLEEKFYTKDESGFIPKNRPFDSLEELNLVSGMDEKLFNSIKNYLTVFPKEGSFRVNIDTAPKNVLLALVRSKAGALTNTELSDADSLVDKMLAVRAGSDQIEMTADDVAIEQNELGLNANETAIFGALNEYRARVSNFFHVRSKGTVDYRDVSTTIDAVIARDNLKILSWRRD